MHPVLRLVAAGTEVWGALVGGMVWGEEIGFKACVCNISATPAGELASNLHSAQIKRLACPRVL